eukprot:m.62738 g.62738  ORF g.62738 m.62738 type:complete len:842 (+) comp19396_c0_seq1:163-2688(+)
MSGSVIHLEPLTYVYVTNLRTNITDVVLGPRTLVLQNDECLVGSVNKCVIVPPNSYAAILNPVRARPEGQQCELKHGEREIRVTSDPFPLYPGEELIEIASLPVVPVDHALKLKARCDHVDNGVARKAGDVWQLPGPFTYTPTPEAEIIEVVSPVVIPHDHAVLMKAKQSFTDAGGEKRLTGEMWLVKRPGAYLPHVHAEVVRPIDPHVLTENTAIHVKATDAHTDDSFKLKRRTGDQWLVTSEHCATFLPDVAQEVTKVVQRTVLNNRQYCIVLNPSKPTSQEGKRKNSLGQRELRRGPASFFLHPGESLQGGIKDVYVLGKDEALVLQAREAFKDTDAVDISAKGEAVQRQPGDIWMIKGPGVYVPPITVNVKDVRSAIQLAQNDGIYIRDTKSGEVRMVMGPRAYLLQAQEELWRKPLTPLEEKLLQNGGGIADSSVRKAAYFESAIDGNSKGPRDPTHVVTYRCPHNAAVQVNNFQDGKTRVVLGPDLVILGPHETFNVLHLSAGKPKKEGALKCLPLLMGPDYITDEIQVETSDHARLSVRYAVNNHFEYEKGNEASLLKMFNVPDFVGIACRELASRIRGAVAQQTFDKFHRYSARIIRQAVFGVNSKGKIRDTMKFPQNGLVLTNIDIQNISPVEMKMQDLLARSVQMAIEISTKSLEEAAKHEANREEQAARGRLERQQIENQQSIETAKKLLFELRAASSAVDSTGQAKAEAQANAERLLIEGDSEIVNAQLTAESKTISAENELSVLTEARAAEMKFQQARNDLEVFKKKSFAQIQVNKFKSLIKTLKPETLVAISKARPVLRMRILESLGLSEKIFYDPENPLKLFASMA